jgi:hypothetical protein
LGSARILAPVASGMAPNSWCVGVWVYLCVCLTLTLSWVQLMLEKYM